MCCGRVSPIVGLSLKMLTTAVTLLVSMLYGCAREQPVAFKHASNQSTNSEQSPDAPRLTKMRRGFNTRFTPGEVNAITAAGIRTSHSMCTDLWASVQISPPECPLNSSVPVVNHST